MVRPSAESGQNFSKSEFIFCVFLAENQFVDALILFIRASRNDPA
jgi:hypothetical protein